MPPPPAVSEAGVVVSGLVLAAGASRRMGRAKALIDFRGRTFLESVLETLAAGGCAGSVVVLGHDPDTIRAGARLGLRPDTHVVVNPDWEQGQFTSVQAGIRAVAAAAASAATSAATAGPVACVVALVDQPHIPASVIRALIETFIATRAPIVRPTHAGRGGHPVLLSAALFKQILTLPTTATLYDVMQRHATGRVDVPVESEAVRQDVDSPRDLEFLG